MEHTEKTVEVYQLCIWIRRISSQIWRRLLMRSDSTIAELHDALQEEASPEVRKLARTLHEFDHYIRTNQSSLPNYGDRYRNGEPISSALAESSMNQIISKRFVKKQQMRWTRRGAHLLSQIRTRVLDETLQDTFQR